jgi:2-polyprenyl-3-methyl-5-hydroxy-6-metoxy-1,4-benzoquinol methylase
VTGLDYLEDGVAELIDRGYDVIQADAETFDLDESFDTIVAGELIEHLERPGAFLNRANAHLEDDGHLVLSTPQPWMLYYYFKSMSGEVPVNPEHTCWFDAQTIRQLLARCGFEVHSIEYPEPSTFHPLAINHRLRTGFLRFTYSLGLERLSSDRMVIVATPASQ